MQYLIIFILCFTVTIFTKEIFATSHLPECKIENNRVITMSKNYPSDNCYATIIYEDGNKYIGEWIFIAADTLQGQGTIIYKDGSKYVGKWFQNRRNGQGTMTYENGRKYVGEWIYRDNEQLGTGQIFYENGLQYIGDWGMDGQRQGQGTMVDENGNAYIGKWDDDKRHGQGKMIYSDGFQYIGNWENNERSFGQCTLIYSNGTEISAYINSGIFGYGYYKINSILDLRDFLLFWYYKINNQR